MAFPKGAPPTIYWLTEAKKMLQEKWGGGNKEYNRFMNLFADTAHRFGLDGAIADPAVCSAVEARHGTKALQKDKIGLFDVSILKSSSICVNNFFQSTKNKSAAEVNQISKMKVQDGSIWDEVCKLASARSPVQVQYMPSVRSMKRPSIKAENPPSKKQASDHLLAIGISGQWPPAPPIAEMDIGSVVSVKSFQEKYILGNILGQGSYGVVFSAREAHAGTRMAVKVEVSEGGTASVAEVGRSYSYTTLLVICATHQTPLTRAPTPYPTSTNATQTSPQITQH
jgi:hypothetical protein